MKKPSITELLDLLDKPAVVKWANKIGLQGVSLNEFRQQKKSSGRLAHSEIERETFADPVHAYNYSKFMEGKRVVAREVEIETEYFVGRYDAKLFSSDLTWLVDWKREATRLYFEHRLQLVAYSMAEPCDRMAIVGVPDFRLIEFDPGKDRVKYEQIIIALSRIYTLKQELME